jgi:hypothetical protein
VTEERARFETNVTGIWGLWPSTPSRWSHSSLKEVEACPSQWMLSRADYPAIWQQRGYPPPPVVAAVFGNVVHGVVERLAKELGAAGIASASEGDVVSVLGSLGGLRAILLDAIDRELTRLGGNPRATPEQVGRVRDELVRQLPDAADQVKVFLRRGAFLPPRGSGASADAEAAGTEALLPRSPAGPGAHVELEVTAETLRMTGRVDLLIVDDTDVDITDFKTGLESEDHDDQVRLYALMWYLDMQVNPARRLATRLRLAYSEKERAVAAPDAAQLQSLEKAIRARVEAADEVTRNPPPIAHPSEENCRFCNVKHLCDAYWTELPPAVAGVLSDQWFDFEGRILRQNGSRSWFAESLADPPAEVLVRTVDADVAFQVGGRARLLGVRRSQDPDAADRLVISMVRTSEWYLLSP